MDLRPAISALVAKAGAVAGKLLSGRQCQCRHRQGELFPARRRAVDAGEEEPDAAGFKIFHASAEVSDRSPGWRNARHRRAIRKPGAGRSAGRLDLKYFTRL